MTECQYSFYDLFHAAYSKKPTIEQIANFENLSQAGKNELIKKWAEIAGWEVLDKFGEDGVTYTAFAPTFDPEKQAGDLARFGISDKGGNVSDGNDN